MMKFNFPGIGNCLIELLREFVPKIPGVENLALQHPHIGGCFVRKKHSLILSIRNQEWWSQLTILGQVEM